MRASSKEGRLAIYFDDEFKQALDKLPHQIFAYKGFEGRALEIVTLPKRQGNIGAKIIAGPPGSSSLPWRIVISLGQRNNRPIPDFKLTGVTPQLNGAGFKIVIPDGHEVYAPAKMKIPVSKPHIPQVVTNILQGDNGIISLAQFAEARKIVNKFVEQNSELVVLSVENNKLRCLMALEED